MNQGKLEAVKQEMARVNINILGISELKWTGLGECNSDDHYTSLRSLLFYGIFEDLGKENIGPIP